MSYVPDEEMLLWLEQVWTGEFLWDENNLEKLKKHTVTQEEVESVFFGSFLFMGKIFEPPGSNWNENRYAILGRSKTNRTFAVVWTLRDEKIRSITCRGMRKNEKKNYNAEERK